MIQLIQSHYRNLLHLDLVQSELAKIINVFWLKLINKRRRFKILKLKYEIEEESVENLETVWNSTSKHSI